MDSKKRFTTESLTDDLVVKILSQVPYKSFCRFKCVCKAWLAFSSDPHYCQMLPKIPTGFLLGCESSVQLVGLSPNDEKIDGVLTFLPNYKSLEFVDSCNGLVLCKYTVGYTSLRTLHFIVCNPATRKWTMLPGIHPDIYGPRCKTILAFDPSWSMQFYVFNYQEKARKSWQRPGIGKLEVFSSDSSTWLVDNDWRSPIEVDKPHIFIGGVMHLETRRRDILVLEGLEAMSSGILPRGFTIPYPANSHGLANGCFGQSPGPLQCAFSEEGGRSIAVWSLDTYRPCKWSPKHRFSMLDAFERDYFDRVNRFTFCDIAEIHLRFSMQDAFGRDYFDRDRFTFCENAETYQLYRILAFDMKREVLLLIDGNANKLFSYNISNGKLSEIQHAPPSWKYYYYVPCHSKLPG